MIEILASDDSHIELRLTGKLDKADYDKLIPILEEQHARGPRTDYLMILHDFHGWEPAALWEDLKFDWKHRGELGRAAIVGEEKWQEKASRATGLIFPGKVRFFPPDQLTAARDWVRHGSGTGGSRER